MKKRMQQFGLMLAVALTVVTSFSACSDSKDGGVDARDVYVGSYRVNWNYILGAQEIIGTYTLTITKSATNDNDVILNNINGSNESARAMVSGNAIVIPQQTIASDGISGSGTLNNNVLNFSTLVTRTAGGQMNVTQVGTKQ